MAEVEVAQAQAAPLQEAPVRVLGIGDSDSYVKWGATVLDAMPGHWQRELVVVDTPVTPSDAQLSAALAGSGFAAAGAPVVDLAGVMRRVAQLRPDVVLVSVRGQVARVLVRGIVAAAADAGFARPVIITGLPGISIPATTKALYYRSQCDYFLLHSKREIADFRALAMRIGVQQDFGLASLPFLPRPYPVGSAEAEQPKTDIIFAAQAKVPRELDDRLRLLDWLVAAARAQPTRRVVIKLRGVAGEPQTHAEKYPFDTLLAEMADRIAPETLPPNLVIETGPMREHLDRAVGLVTVSSTAAIEAAALDVPIIALDDFGTSAQLINLVFEASNLLASSPALVEGRFRRPSPSWLDLNYFHEPSDNTWLDGVEQLLARRAAGQLPLRQQYRGRLGGTFRHAWDRKLAFGHLDTSLSGTVANLVGQPVRWSLVASKRALRSMKRV